MKKMELLAPAGSIESLYCAVHAGADAIYIGGSRFGARAYADNPQEQQLLEGLDYCHLHQVRVYLTVNTLFRERELAELPAFLEPYYLRGLDGVIVQDLGAASVIRNHFPDLPLHASTQMTITSPYSADYLRQMGFCRIVPARELSLKEIDRLARVSRMEIEVFVHGALCYCYSGQCLASSMIGGRSGNRGRCAQPCRLPWQLEKDGRVISEAEKPFLLSLKDLCALPYLAEFAENGVTSLKIEGRMKRPEYTAGVVQIYRKYLDLLENSSGLVMENGRIVPEEEDIRMLQDLYSRGGFTEGYSHNYNGPSMMSMRRPNHLGSLAAVVERTGSTSGKQGRNSEKRGKKTYTGRNEKVIRTCTPLSAGDILEAALDGHAERTWTADRDYPAEARISMPQVFQDLSAGTRLFRTRNEGLLSSLAGTDKKKPRIKIKGVLMLFPGKPAILEATFRNFHVRTQGETVQEAQSRPLTREDLEKQLTRTGDSPFLFASLDIQTGTSVFLPVRELNRIRRETLDRLSGEIIRASWRQKKEIENSCFCLAGPDTSAPERFPAAGSTTAFHCEAFPFLSGYSISVQEEQQLHAVLDMIPHMKYRPDRIILDGSDLWLDPEAADRVRQSGCACYFAPAPVLRERTAAWYGSEEVTERLAEADGFQVRTLDMAGYLTSAFPQKPLMGDEGLYACNPEAVRVLESLGIRQRVLPAELTFAQMEHLTVPVPLADPDALTTSGPAYAGNPAGDDSFCGAELTVYGRQLLMITAQCLLKNTDRCRGQSGRMTLRDRKNMEFPVRTLCRECCNTIWNSLPLCLFSCTQQIRRLQCARLRLSFTFESGPQTVSVLDQFSHFLEGREVLPLPDTTRGHFIKGVE